MSRPKGGGEGGLVLGLTLNSACLELCMLQAPSLLQLQVQAARWSQTGFYRRALSPKS